MKQKHTQAKKARRASWFQKEHRRIQSMERLGKRFDLQPKPSHTKGYQVVRVQRIFLKKDRFGNPIYKTVSHAKYRAEGVLA